MEKKSLGDIIEDINNEKEKSSEPISIRSPSRDAIKDYVLTAVDLVADPLDLETRLEATPPATPNIIETKFGCLNMSNKTILVEQIVSMREIYSECKDIFTRPDLIIEEEPIVAITHNLFECINGWTLDGSYSRKHVRTDSWKEFGTIYLRLTFIGENIGEEVFYKFGTGPVVNISTNKVTETVHESDVIPIPVDTNGDVLKIGNEQCGFNSIAVLTGQQTINTPVILAAPWPNRFGNSNYVGNLIKSTDELEDKKNAEKASD